MNYYDEEPENKTLELIESFSLEDFLKFPATRDVLLEEHKYEFETRLEPAIHNFFRKEVGFCQKSYSTVFANERELEHIGIFKAIVFNNIEPNHDLEIFSDNPRLAASMVNTYKERCAREEEDRLKKIKEGFASNSATIKTYDWSAKTYK
jgi:uncharacterized protein involved in type VI secretion and phage assembly|tara:strand:+ start:26029 stop:26478 length:450 start_codon:yes stop_codon:yes gene_type:complete